MGPGQCLHLRAAVLAARSSKAGSRQAEHLQRKLYWESRDSWRSRLGCLRKKISTEKLYKQQELFPHLLACGP